MRFSLLSLLLATLTAGSGMGVFILRGTWRQVGRDLTLEEVEKLAPREFSPRLRTYVSPDKTRWIDNRSPSQQALLWQDIGEPVILYQFQEYGSASFVDDSNVLIDYPPPPAHFSGSVDLRLNYPPPPRFGFWHRRYPEWWWGHFYRPEVLCLIVFGVLFVGNASRRFLARSAKAGAA